MQYTQDNLEDLAKAVMGLREKVRRGIIWD